MPLAEQNAAYWDRRPCNIGHGSAEVGSSLWSIQIGQRKYLVEPHILDFALFRCWQGKEVLEIGCGLGTDTIEFAKAGANVQAVESSARTIELALVRVGIAECYGVKIWLSDAEYWQPPGPFDLIYSFGVLHHTPHPEKILRLAHERLKDTGELRIMLYAKWSWKHLFTRQQPEAQAGCPLVRWYSMKAARHLVESCGFKVVSIEKTHIFPWRISDYIEHRYVKAFPWNFISRRLFRSLESKLGHHLLIVAVKA
jgi:SAM-dependent methyltransferase